MKIYSLFFFYAVNADRWSRTFCTSLMYPGNECLYCAEWVSSRQSYRLYEEIVPIISFPLNSFLYLSFLLFITTPNKYLFFSSLPRPTNIFSSLHYHAQQMKSFYLQLVHCSSHQCLSLACASPDYFLLPFASQKHTHTHIHTWTMKILLQHTITRAGVSV